MTMTPVLSLLLAATAFAAENPLFEKSPLPYQLPQFGSLKDSDFKPAFEEGMKRQLKEVDAISPQF
jgi:peptidyl-dipeptidase Dcp